MFTPGETDSHKVAQMTHNLLVDKRAGFQTEGVDPISATTSVDAVTHDMASENMMSEGLASNFPLIISKRKAEDQSSAPEPEPQPDIIKLWEDGYADRYYEQKFYVDPNDVEFRHQVARDYAIGLCWIMRYYFQECPSWQWYYPHHYAPFAADFVDLDQLEVKFDKGKPSRPYEQLMSVMPAASKHTIPEHFHDLMTDNESEIIDFYPEDFEIDLNGKKWAHQGVALLPFINEERLLGATMKKYPLLSEDENIRNGTGKDVLLFSDRHPLYEEVSQKLYSKQKDESKLNLNPKITHGLAGKIEKNESYIPGLGLIYPFNDGRMPNLKDDNSMSVNFEMPVSELIHKSMLLRGARFPKPSLANSDIEAARSKTSRGPYSYENPDRSRNLYGDRSGFGRGGRSLGPPNTFAPFVNPNSSHSVRGIGRPTNYLSQQDRHLLPQRGMHLGSPRDGYNSGYHRGRNDNRYEGRREGR